MIWILIAVLISACTVGQSAFTKEASGRCENTDSIWFNVIKTGGAFVFFFLISVYGIAWHTPTVLYASLYGAVLFFSTILGYLALKNGSMAVTSLIVSYSVIIPCLFGIFVLNEAVSFVRILGIVMLLVSMFLLKKNDKLNINKQWIFCVTGTFFCNGICSVVQKLHQTAYPGEYCEEFMAVSFLVTFILFALIYVYNKLTAYNKDKTEKDVKAKEKVTKGNGVIKYAVIAGILMGLGNYLTLVLSAKVSATVLFPMISVFSMFCNVIVSKLYFKDKFGVFQIIGIFVGVFSVLLIK